MKAGQDEHECEEFLARDFAWNYLAGVVLLNLISAYFASILYQHYRNSELPVTEGGLIQMAPKQSNT